MIWVIALVPNSVTNKALLFKAQWAMAEVCYKSDYLQHCLLLHRAFHCSSGSHDIEVKMNDFKYLFAVVFVCGLATICSSGKPTVEKIETNLGGGDCVDAEDCNDNGICKPESEGKGVCSCVVGFAGRNCEDKDTESSSPRSETEWKRSRLRKPLSGGLKRTLHYDTNSNLVGLSPKSVAEAQQPILLFSPASEKYLFVSKDYKVTGKHNAYTEARGDRLGKRNLFLIKKLPGEDKFHIFNIEQNAYLYVSNSKSGFIGHWNKNVLASTVAPDNADSPEKFVFEFEDEDGDGFYEIKNQGLYLYVSRHYHGIPSYPLIKAATKDYLKRREVQFFQLTLKENAANIKFLVTGEEERNPNILTLRDGTQCSKTCFDGDPKTDAAQDVSVKYTDSSKDSRTYSKTEGFSVSADSSGLTASVGKLTFTYKNDQTTTDVSENTRTVEKSLSIKVKPKQCACIEVTFQEIQYTRQFNLEATTRERKVIKASGHIEGNRLANFEAQTKMFPFAPNFKCPHEKP